jgi:chloride channel protein, CIC family
MLSFSALKKRLAFPQTSWQLCLLAIVGGAASALLIVAFLLSIRAIQSYYFIERDDYSSLDLVSRFDLPIIGALIILLLGWLTGYKYLRTGIPFVLNRLKVAHGIIPLKNTLNQFWGSVAALAAGFSVGKEGPSVHLGAACSSYIGSLLNLPYNSIRTLCACGIAAGIAATFNTPIAAVIFVMEVILRDYKIHLFIPVMLAATVGSLITSSLLGSVHELAFLQKIALDLIHYPYLVLLGILLGILGFLFNRYLILIIKYSKQFHITTRLMLAALITGTLGMFVPAAMGTALAGIEFSLTHSSMFYLLLILLATKLVMTTTALGLGIPGGIIGPIVGIGAIAGVCFSAVILPVVSSENLANDFALMGMAGFLAATLNAPLTALLTIVELSRQMEIIPPAMIVITVACLISGQLLKNKSVFTMQLSIQGLIYKHPPIERALQKIGALAALQENFTLLEAADNNMGRSNNGNITSLAEHHFNKQETNEHTLPLIIKEKHSPEETTQFYWLEQIHDDEYKPIQLTAHKLIPLSDQTTLDQAYNALATKRCGGVYLYDKSPEHCLGFISFEQIRQYLVEGTLIK